MFIVHKVVKGTQEAQGTVGFCVKADLMGACQGGTGNSWSKQWLLEG